MTSRRNFWTEDAGRCPNAPITDTMLVAAEETLRCRLPYAFVDLLRIRNGGSTRGFILPVHVRTSWAQDHVPFAEMFGVGADSKEFSSHDVLCSPYMTKEWGLPPSQVLICGEGDWWITLDYRRSPAPCVTWLDVDAAEDVMLAPTFDSFLAALVPSILDDETTLRLNPGNDVA